MGKKFLLNFSILISTERISWEYGFANVGIRMEVTFWQIFKKPSYNVLLQLHYRYISSKEKNCVIKIWILLSKFPLVLFDYEV